MKLVLKPKARRIIHEWGKACIGGRGFLKVFKIERGQCLGRV